MRVSAKQNLSELLRVSQRLSLELVIIHFLLEKNSERESRCARWNLSALLSAPPVNGRPLFPRGEIPLLLHYGSKRSANNEFSMHAAAARALDSPVQRGALGFLDPGILTSDSEPPRTPQPTHQTTLRPMTKNMCSEVICASVTLVSTLSYLLWYWGWGCSQGVSGMFIAMDVCKASR